MDRNTIIGFILIFAVFIGFSYLNRPSQEQIEVQKRYNDSIAAVEIQRQQTAMEQEISNDTTSLTSEAQPDSVVQAQMQNTYGAFATSSSGEENFITLENNLVEIKISTKGGRVYSARLKEYTAYDSLPLILFDAEESSFNTTLVTANNRVINTSEMFFEPVQATSDQATMRLKAGENGSLDFVYTLQPDDYMLRFEIVSKNLEQHLAPSFNSLDIQWMQKIRQQEKGRKFEERYARLMYKYLADDVEEMSDSKDASENLSNKLKWIGYKDQFFSTVLIADESLESTKLDSRYLKDGGYLKQYNTTTSIAFDPKNNVSGFYFYFGPNDYPLLKGYDKKIFKEQDVQLEKLVPLGWSLFRYINKWVIIPIFDWLTSFCGSIGLAIFLLTLIIKMALFPLTYKSFMSSAKMRVLRPQIEEVNAKYPGQDNAMTRQQKTMEVYRQVGVNPMSGCLPMLLQMPFLFALFMFFPSAIELRHESFLWAKDLSTFDAIISWDAYIPFITPYFGNHISLFCLLMTATNMIYTKYNMEQTNTGQQQMPGMKLMMYGMPVFMLVFLNSYPAGLNYYYFISTLITVIQTLLFRYFLNEDKLLKQLEQNKKKPAKKKSGFMARLEEAQRQQQQALAKQRAQQQKGGKR